MHHLLQSKSLGHFWLLLRLLFAIFRTAILRGQYSQSLQRRIHCPARFELLIAFFFPILPLTLFRRLVCLLGRLAVSISNPLRQLFSLLYLSVALFTFFIFFYIFFNVVMFVAWFDQSLRRTVCENNPLLLREAKVCVHM